MAKACPVCGCEDCAPRACRQMELPLPAPAPVIVRGPNIIDMAEAIARLGLDKTGARHGR